MGGITPKLLVQIRLMEWTTEGSCLSVDLRMDTEAIQRLELQLQHRPGLRDETRSHPGGEPQGVGLVVADDQQCTDAIRIQLESADHEALGCVRVLTWLTRRIACLLRILGPGASKIRIPESFITLSNLT